MVDEKRVERGKLNVRWQTTTLTSPHRSEEFVEYRTLIWWIYWGEGGPAHVPFENRVATPSGCLVIPHVYVFLIIHRTESGIDL